MGRSDLDYGGEDTDGLDLNFGSEARDVGIWATLTRALEGESRWMRKYCTCTGL